MAAFWHSWHPGAKEPYPQSAAGNVQAFHELYLHINEGQYLLTDTALSPALHPCIFVCCAMSSVSMSIICCQYLLMDFVPVALMPFAGDTPGAQAGQGRQSHYHRLCSILQHLLCKCCNEVTAGMPAAPNQCCIAELDDALLQFGLIA